MGTHFWASNLARPSGPCGRGWAAGRWGRRGGERRGARTHPEARARAPALLHVHLDCRGAGDGTTVPHPHQLFLRPPPAVLPRRQLGAGRRGRCKGSLVAAAARLPRARRSDVNGIRRRTPPTAPSPSPSWPWPASQPAETPGRRLRPGDQKQGACRCSEPPAPSARAGETGSRLPAVPRLPGRRQGSGVVGPDVGLTVRAGDGRGYVKGGGGHAPLQVQRAWALRKRPLLPG